MYMCMCICTQKGLFPLLPHAPTIALSQSGEQAGLRWLLHSAGSKPWVSTFASSAAGNGEEGIVLRFYGNTQGVTSEA